ncbi:glycosyltransferase family 4 protein [Candidatus Uhrbacteria bacterium]|nr:glycosyltransferase family 4 protein [Candidatus Uhrbacteria bacterium]
MTIGIDASRAFRQVKTGTEWYSWHIIRSLIELGELRDDQLVLYLNAALSADDADVARCKSVALRVLSWPLRHFWTQARLSLEMFIKPPDVLFVPAHAIPLIHPKRTVTTIHDVGFLRYPQCYAGKELSNLRFSTAYAMRHASRIITISEFSKQEILANYKIDPSGLHVIGLGCDHNQYYPRGIKEVLPALKKYHVNQPYIISVGRIDTRKNTSAVIETFEQMKKSGYPGSLVLIGPLGYGSDAVLAQIGQSPVKNHIIHLGWISEEDKIALICGAEAMLFLSKYEGFGLPVIEAQSCGILVVCSRAGALPEVAGDAALYCDAQDKEQCSQTVLQAISDTAMRARLRDAGFANAARYSWRTAAEKVLSVLQIP